mmetsp:Transcript_21383/g.53838  ORF Transcript_21383/g.53838 Transcript_21383/m.53838 type:complete len:249 (+) Transcript_21383:160-906(+)
MFQENESQPLRNVEDGSQPPEELTDKLETAVRHGFVRKVFAIVGVQLAITALISYPFVFYGEHAKIFIQNNQALLTICMMIPIALICYSFCDPSIAREYPKNYFFIGVITVCFGMLVGASCAMYTTQSVLLVAALTAGIVISLVLFACQTTYDFTGMGPYLFSIMIVLCLVSFVMMFLPYSRPMEVAYSGIAALLFSFYIVYDTQLIVGGKHSRHRFSVDEYCFAALNLYMDIINLFLHLLRIMGDRR